MQRKLIRWIVFQLAVLNISDRAGFAGSVPTSVQQAHPSPSPFLSVLDTLAYLKLYDSQRRRLDLRDSTLESIPRDPVAREKILLGSVGPIPDSPPPLMS